MDDIDISMDDCSPPDSTRPDSGAMAALINSLHSNTKSGERPVAEEDFTQWRRNGNGHIPCGPTLKQLDAGPYSFQYINDMLTVVKQPTNSDKLIRFPDSTSDEVIDDIQNFWKIGDRYKRFGLSHKRGFLLHGPQGSGKTSCISFITQEHTKNNGVTFFVDNGVHPLTLATFLVNARKAEPNRYFLVVLEDVDAIIKQYGERDLLSLLDGQLSINKVVFIGTTNYLELIEPRVKNRPSRFDRVLQINTPNTASRKLYLKSRELDLTESQYDKWAEDTQGFSVAHLKELIISVYCYDQKYEDALGRIKDMFKSAKSNSLEQSSSGFTAGLRKR
jgi:hypothetical protein